MVKQTNMSVSSIKFGFHVRTVNDKIVTDVLVMIVVLIFVLQSFILYAGLCTHRLINRSTKRNLDRAPDCLKVLLPLKDDIYEFCKRE